MDILLCHVRVNGICVLSLPQKKGHFFFFLKLGAMGLASSIFPQHLVWILTFGENSVYALLPKIINSFGCSSYTRKALGPTLLW